MSAARGRFITFEGGEGAGKSTQVARLVARLKDEGVEAVATREPGGSPRAEILRAFILSGRAKALGAIGEAALFSAARADHIDTLIRPALARGAWVVCDRFADSTRAYQGAAGEVDPALIEEMQRVALDGVAVDLTLLMDLSPEAGLARADARRGGAGVDRFEGEAPAFHRALRQAFLDIAAREPARVMVVDADRDADAIEADIWARVSARFGLAREARAS